ncbi:unnamed protein product [Rotaria sordida]|uniref:DoxX family protein n=1 Tax=Rotaria sordida TaxID=392033 RepID=A0A814JNS2_9BILA|nr:unnamed protein product [Rotaria sordida]CAF0962081.1 unnamed protein product [Rotaria sordida]CAF1039553.1 unnamed protein product [Rotaria sordida]CAF1039986.1 unnamed protein product [Rotaria sordida]CAF3828386.1 unnamed protein product [Rotaria sordida]
MASLGLHLLTLILGVVFIFSGHVKLTPQFFPEQHTHIKNEFGKYNKEFPLYHQTGWRPYAKNYRITIGITEIVCGIFLLLGFSQTLATLVLLMVMINAIVTFQKINYPIEYTGIFVVVSLLLLLRLGLTARSTVKQTVKSTKAKIEKKVE